ncbi:MAG: energy-coupling factor transporter transmembrane component T [Nitrososphaerota archaeon]
MSLLSVVLVNFFSWFLFLFNVALPLYLLLGAIGLTGFREISSYQKHTTFYYRLNPITKVALAVAITFVVAFTVWWIDLAILLAFLATYMTLKNGKRKILVGGAFAFSATVGLMWWWAANTPYTLLDYALFHECVTSVTDISNLGPLWTWPSYFTVIGYQPVLTLGGIFYGLQVATRTATVFIVALILIMTSTPSQILRALRKLKLPILIIFSLVVAMRTVPRIFDSLDTAVKVQFMRGYGSDAPLFLRVFYLAGAALTGIVPAMTFLFRGARNTAISADTRAFRAYNDRTYLRPVVFSRGDYYMWILIAGFIVLAIVGNLYGFGRGIPYAAVGSTCGGSGFG